MQDSFHVTPWRIPLGSFVGRKDELLFLSQAYFEKGIRVVCLVGLSGIGKSAFADKFANDNQHKFPGGVVVIAARFSSAIQTSLNRLQKDKPCLIIWDDIDFLQNSYAFEEVESAIDRYPKSFHLLISRYMIEHRVVYTYLHLGGLNHSEMQLLFKTRLEGYSRVDFERFWQLFLGHPLAAELAITCIRNGIYTANEIVKSLGDFEEPCLFGPDGRPLTKDSYDAIITDISSVNDDLLRKLEKDPKIFYQLSSRKFEEVIAEVFNRMGYQIILTPATRDGGKDIYAAKKDNLGTFLYIVECKKFGPDNHVGVSLVRELYGVVQAERATAGILATTSFFSKPAQEFQESIKYHVSLRDYMDIQKWLKSINKL
ncbi:MAG: restriction endonuclease [candidate division Zixibacteria bacterium]|nr:restriction endonuclease [candidate division Zixibacteria bacterium]